MTVDDAGLEAGPEQADQAAWALHGGTFPLSGACRRRVRRIFSRVRRHGASLLIASARSPASNRLGTASRPGGINPIGLTKPLGGGSVPVQPPKV